RLPRDIVGLLGRIVRGSDVYLAQSNPGMQVVYELELEAGVLGSVLSGLDKHLASKMDEDLLFLASVLGSTSRSYKGLTLETRLQLQVEKLPGSDRFIVGKKYTTLWCHNGIAAPGLKNDRLAYSTEEARLGVIELGRPSSLYRPRILFFGVLAFADRLRP